MRQEFLWTDMQKMEFADFVLGNHLQVPAYLSDAKEIFMATQRGKYKILMYRMGDFTAPDLSYFSGGMAEIHSAIREIDGCVFAHGDFTDIGEIIKIYESGRSLRIKTDSHDVPLKDVKRITRPTLFKAHDGKECADGETVFGVALKAEDTTIIVQKKLPFPPRSSQQARRTWFSDYALALEHVCENKLTMSIALLKKWSENGEITPLILSQSDNLKYLVRRELQHQFGSTTENGQ